jgi:NTP pyrophosphatase (non-canonical NTP hydrolase)
MSSKVRVFIDVEDPIKMQEVFNELKRAQELYPEWPENHFERLAILTEEVGELSQALLDFKHGKCGFKHVQEEANQVAAMGLRFRIELARCL